MNIGERIQALRRERGLSQEELAERLGVSRQAISQWETGQTVPSVDNLYRIKELFGVSFDDIFSGEAQNETQIDKQLTAQSGLQTPPQGEPQPSTPSETFFMENTEVGAREYYKLIYRKLKQRFALLGLCFVMMVFNVIVSDGGAENWIAVGVIILLCVIFMLRSLIRYRKDGKAFVNSFVGRRFKFELFNDCFTVDSYLGDALTGSAAVSKGDITDVCEFGDWIYFVFDGHGMIIRKADLPSDRMVGVIKYYRKCDDPQTEQKIRRISIALVAASVATLFAVPLAANLGSEINPMKYMWLCYLLIPIPIASIVFGIFQRKKGRKTRKNIVVGTIFLILLLVYGSFPFIFKDFISDDFSIVSHYEQVLGIDLPNSGEISTQNFPQDGAKIEETDILLFSISTISLDDADAAQFKKEIEQSPLWLDSVPTDIEGAFSPTDAALVSENTKSMLYNITEKEFNTLPAQSGIYRFICLIYNKSGKVLHITEYEKTVSVPK